MIDSKIMDLKKFNVQIRDLEQIKNPDDLFNLRKTIYHEEYGDIPLASVLDKDDEKAIHILAYYAEDLVGAVRLLPARNSQLIQNKINIRGEAWCIGRLMVKKTFRGNNIAHILTYSACSFLRVKKCENLLTYYPKKYHYSTIKVYRARSLDFSEIYKRPGGENVEVQFYYFPEIEWMAYKSFSLLRSENWRRIAIEQAAIPFLKEYISARISIVYHNILLQKTKEKTLALEQYIDALCNNLKLVQWTTRILAMAASITEDRDLRNHYLGYLRGEVDHDLWIEEDLKYLGADVKYYRDYKVSDPAIADFMNCQGSLVSHSRNPVHFMVLSLIIEEITTFWKPEDMESLESCIRGWGYSDPAKATKFYSSHIRTDGKAKIGHWHQTFKLLPSYISSEYDVSKMYQMSDCVSSAVDRAFEKFASKQSLKDMIGVLSI